MNKHKVNKFTFGSKQITDLWSKAKQSDLMFIFNNKNKR